MILFADDFPAKISGAFSSDGRNRYLIIHSHKCKLTRLFEKNCRVIAETRTWSFCFYVANKRITTDKITY